MCKLEDFSKETFFRVSALNCNVKCAGKFVSVFIYRFL